MNGYKIFKYIFLLLFIIFVVWLIKRDIDRQNECAAKGGEMIRSGQYSKVCLKKGTKIEL